jgi:hypothetical protein
MISGSRPLLRIALLTLCIAGPSLVATAVAQAQGTDTAAAAAAKPKPPRPKANLISAEEIASLGGTVQTAFGIVQRLRPAMLRARSGSASRSEGGASSNEAAANEVQVYLDNQKMGGARALEEIMLFQIMEIRYLSANDATTLFGTGNAAGAIQVIGKR